MSAVNEGIRETALGAELKFDRVAMRKRRETLQRGDHDGGWWKDGATIIWSEKAANQLRELVSPSESVEIGPEPPESSLDADKFLRVVKLCPNSSWVICDENGYKVRVRVKKGAGRKMLRKTIRVGLADGFLTHKP
jgi:hypothetical protein